MKVLVIAAAILLAGCSGNVVPRASDDGSVRSNPPASAPPAVVPLECSDEMVDFVEALEELDSRLTVGLNFSAYSDHVGDAQVAYDRINADELNTTCVELVGVPAEDAFNAYVDAYNTWNDCIGDVNCDNDSITPDLQAKWAEATDLIEQARDHLDR